MNENNVVSIAIERLEKIIDFPTNAKEIKVMVEGKPYGRIFHVSWKHRIDSVPVEGDFISVELDPAGDMISFRKIWHGINVDTKATITEEEAIKKAKETAFIEQPSSTSGEKGYKR